MGRNAKENGGGRRGLTITARLRVGGRISWSVAVMLIGAALTVHDADGAVPDEAAARSWKQISASHLTPDGTFLVYTTGRWGKPGQDQTLVIRSVLGTRELRFPLVGDHAFGTVKLSPSGKWVGFRDERGVSVVDLASGKRTNWPEGDEFAFIAGKAERLLVKMKSGAVGAELRLIDLQARRDDFADAGTHIENVRAYAASSGGDRLAWAGSAGVEILDLASGVRRVLDQGYAFKGLSWSPEGDSLAAVKRNDEPGIVVFTHLEHAKPARVEIDGVSSDATILPSVVWRADGQGIFFRLQRESSSGAGTPPGPVIWSSTAPRLPPERVGSLPDWHFASLSTGAVLRVEDPSTRADSVPRCGNFVLLSDLDVYGWRNAQMGRMGVLAPHLRDHYLLDLRNGERRRVLSGLPVVSRLNLALHPQLSPDGNWLVYQGPAADYAVLDTRTGVTRSLTAALADRFRIQNNAPENRKLLREPSFTGPLLQGWSTDGRYVLVSDYFDIWALPLAEGRALNLTGGAGGEISYSIMSWSRAVGDEGCTENSVDLSAPIHLEFTELRSGREGIARWDPKSASVSVLHSEYASLSYRKADEAEVYVVSRTNSVEPGNFYGVDAKWRPAAQLTDINPQQKRYDWPPVSRLLRYTNSRGEHRRAILLLPVGYRQGQRYPTLVNVYLLWSTPHEYIAPIGPNNLPFRFQSAGYAVLYPDIDVRPGESGAGALDDTLAGVRAAVEAGIVDPDRLGLYGHSHGAFEANYIAAHSSAFKAIVADAGISNPVSYCGGLYAERMPASTLCEFDQPYLGALWWDAPDVYAKNSPLLHAPRIDTPLLLVHGDADVHVPFSQSVELFNALRRLGKLAALLQYRGEGHMFSDAAQADLLPKLLQFYDHFLQGKASPTWWPSPMEATPPSAATTPRP